MNRFDVFIVDEQGNELCVTRNYHDIDRLCDATEFASSCSIDVSFNNGGFVDGNLYEIIIYDNKHRERHHYASRVAGVAKKGWRLYNDD